MSTRDEVFRAELAHILLRHGGSQQIETAVIRLHREHLADLQTRARDLLDALTRTHVEDPGELWDAVIRLRALVGDTSPSRSRPPADTDTGREGGGA